MSKQRPEKPVEKPVQKIQETPEAAIVFPKDASGKRIEAERFCPICWGRYKGYGTTTNSEYQVKRYYKCDKVLPGSEFGPCGFTWSMEWPEINEARERYIKEMQAVVVSTRPAQVQSFR
jgi:hypothetical protein